MDLVTTGRVRFSGWIGVVSLLVVVLVVTGGFAGPAAGVGDAPASTNGSDLSEQDPDAVSVDPTVRNASGDVELILYLDSLSPSEIQAADDPVERLQSHAQSVQPEVGFALDQYDGVDVKSRSWLANSILVSVDLDRHSIDHLTAIDGVERIGTNANVTALETADERTATTDTHTGDTRYTYGLEQIDAPAAWEKHDTRGEGVRVAVVDTGIDVDHPDLELYTDDPDDPTYPGGWAEFDREGNPVTGSTPHDTGQHGTHVSGTIAGGNASGTHIGVAPDVELLHALGLDASNGGTRAQIIAAIEWAVMNDADIVSLSLGSSEVVPADAIWVRNTKAAGVHVVAASGNSGVGTISSPAAVPDALSVGASDPDRDIAPFSSGETIETTDVWGTATRKGWPDSYVVPDIAAPGVTVKSTVPGAEYEAFSGTSMATPHASGALALMIAAGDDPDLTPTAYERALTESATKPDGAPETQDVRYGHGIIDVPAAIDRLAAYDGGVHGTVTDADGTPLAGVDVSTDTGVRTVSSESGVYRFNSTGGDTTVTATRFGYATQTRSTTVPESGGVTEDFELEETVEASVVREVPRFAESGDSYSGTFRIGNVESYTVTLTDESTVDSASVDITFGGIDVTPGETVEFGKRVDFASVDLTVRTDEAIANETIALQHTFEGVGEDTTVSTRRTTVKSELAPANFEITAFETTERIPENGTIRVNGTIENVGERSDTQPIDYRVVGEGVDRGVTLGTLELEPTEDTYFERDIDTSVLSPGEYVQSIESANDTADRPLVIVERGTISIALDPVEAEGPIGTEHEFDVVVSDPFDGVSAYDITVSITDPEVATIVSVEPERTSGVGFETVSADGSTARLERALGTDPYASADEITVGTVFVSLVDPGTATLAVDEGASLVTIDDTQYTVRSTEPAELTAVSPSDGIDVTGDGTPATDTTGDGRLNDLDGDGEFSIVDVQLFFQYRNSDPVRTNVDQFDFNGNGSIGIADVQRLFDQYGDAH